MNLIRTQNTRGRDKSQHDQVSEATTWGWAEEAGRGKQKVGAWSLAMLKPFPIQKRKETS